MIHKQFHNHGAGLMALPRSVLGALVAALMFVVAPVVNCSEAATNAAKPAASSPRLVGYFAEWAEGRGYHVADIPADRLTHVNYAFAIIRDGQCAPRGKSAPRSSLSSAHSSRSTRTCGRSFPSAGGRIPGRFPTRR